MIGPAQIFQPVGLNSIAFLRIMAPSGLTSYPSHDGDHNRLFESANAW